jgi:hypothetical protein
MRYGLLVLGIIVCLALHQGWFTRAYGRATTAALTDEARLAIDVRCGSDAGRSASDCRTLLKKLYLSGSLDPDKTLRFYCDSVKNARWGGSLPAPPKVCVQRYGGWQEG